jgi:hypothetical protein
VEVCKGLPPRFVLWDALANFGVEDKPVGWGMEGVPNFV